MGSTFQSYLKKTIVIQNKVIRLNNKSESNAHTTKLFKTCNILTLKSMYEIETAKFMFDCVHKTLPKSLMEHFTLNIAYHDHNTRQSRPPHVNITALVLLLIQFTPKSRNVGKFTP